MSIQTNISTTCPMTMPGLTPVVAKYNSVLHGAITNTPILWKDERCFGAMTIMVGMTSHYVETSSACGGAAMVEAPADEYVF
ncbi:MAG: hypothetical protein HC806_00190 [Anaerolineae bacterium]|nr:hypothetical protein [Anaerolineae bacterium]